jgi:KEOPS complex subunit Pcc1
VRYSATFRFSGADARALYFSVCQEAGDVGGRSSVHVSMEGNNTLVLEARATDAAALRAALNTWLRLVNIAIEMRELADRETDPSIFH